MPKHEGKKHIASLFPKMCFHLNWQQKKQKHGKTRPMGTWGQKNRI